MSAHGADYSLTRNYIEWLAVLPWGKDFGPGDRDSKAKKFSTPTTTISRKSKIAFSTISLSPLKPGMKGPIFVLCGPRA